MPPRRNLVLESFRLGIGYLSLAALFFAVSVYFFGLATGDNAPSAYTGHSALLDSLTGLVSFVTMSLAVWYFRTDRMMHNIAQVFLISGSVAVADFFLTATMLKLFYSAGDLSLSDAGNMKEFFMCWTVYFGWCCVFLTILYSFDVRDRERRLVAVQDEAHSAHMRALHYQVNPHFLFNSLNSISGLIEEGASLRAGNMVHSLSTFLRNTLTLDPCHDVPLHVELAMQEEYLKIEHERFSDRMTFRIDASDAVRQALIPSLILQPLIENAIKHGVGATVGKVNITLAAHRDADRLRVTVENHMPQAAVGPKPIGMGIGLKNVADRLHARFEEDTEFSARPAAPGLYRVTLDMPWLENGR